MGRKRTRHDQHHVSVTNATRDRVRAFAVRHSVSMGAVVEMALDSHPGYRAFLREYDAKERARRV